MISIRLKETGTKSLKKWRVVVTDSAAPRNGRLIEEIGFYNPAARPEEIKIKLDRYESWLKKGAQPSETVASLVKRNKIVAK